MATAVATKKTGFPPQIKYIIGNEAAERFSYYGMRSILVIYMVQHLMIPANEAKGVYHLFISANYFLPLVGGYLSDRILGKYKTIIYLSLVYCLGHLVLALWEGSVNGMYAGLALIALGSGGIKPCVSAHVGDQFNKSNSHLISKVYEIFYWSVNFGAFFSTLLIPVILPKYGAAWAFGIPGILMFIATIVFWMGRKQYVHVPPSGKEDGAQFFSILFYSLTHLGNRKKGQKVLDVAKAKFPADKVEGAQAALGVFKVLASVSLFWALFEQHGSSWVLQADAMVREFHFITDWKLEASQISALNPIMVMVLIPLFSMGLYPLIEKLGFKMTPLRKMSMGMVTTGVSFIMAGVVSRALEAGTPVAVAWQIPQYLVLTMAEIMVSINGLEFAYTQSPRAMKSTIMSLWLLTVTVGNMFAAYISVANPFAGKGSSEFFFYATLMFIVSGIFIFMASKYKGRSYIEDKVPVGEPTA